MTRPVERYGVYLAGLDPTRGREIAKTRPVVVVSRDDMNRFLDTVVVCPLTTKLHPRWRSRLQTACAGRKAEIAVDQIRTVSKHRLGRRLDELEPATAMLLRLLITEMYGE
ncbi:MAG: transcription elongation factor GreAB [Betaproteobacteria bacterium RIFCSPLOWO2_02_FULL_67_19]|nr:MAG: transcription elongation factor GreAB [Betaproteobacteria bacterium RIFCSPLOWO2_02_FULL_67_19]